MKKISKTAKILSISHNDWDGVFCQIILGNIYNNITYLNTSFYKIDSILNSLDYDKYDFIFLTDINPTNLKLLDLSEKIILIDHHESAKEANNPSKMHFVISNQCAAKLTLKFVEKYYNIKLNHLHEHCEMVNDYDLWILKNPRSKRLNDLMFYLYRPNKFRIKFFDGRTTFTEDELKWLDERDKEFERLYEGLNVFEFEKLNGCVVESKEFINEICDRLMREESYNIVFCRNPYHGRVSIRHNIEGLDIGTILKEKGIGGGHEKSAGLFCDDMDDFERKAKDLENVVFDYINTHKDD